VASQGELWTIERVLEITDGSIVRGVCDEHRVSMSPDGRTWIRKRVLTAGCQQLMAEAICWLLARELNLAVPLGAVFVCDTDENETSWLSREVSPILHWGESSFEQVENLETLGGLIALDVLTLNNDRHAGNLLLQPKGRNNQLFLWGIDSGNALIGYASDFVERQSEVPTPEGLPLRAIHLLSKTALWQERVVAGAMSTAERISRIESPLLGKFCVKLAISAESRSTKRSSKHCCIVETTL
jgi:hypothetical protein